MADPRKHHFSPVFYLRGWCGSNNTVVEYSRPHLKVVARNVPPTATGYKAFLYTLEGQPDDKKQSIEKDYMAPIVDDPAAHALRILIGGDKDALTEKMRAAWTRFIIASLLRRPQAVSGIADTFKDVLQHNLLDDAVAYESMKEADDPTTTFEWLEKNHPHYVSDAAKQMVVRAVEHEGIGNIIINIQWSTLDLLVSRHELLTADMPKARSSARTFREPVLAGQGNPAKSGKGVHCDA